MAPRGFLPSKRIGSGVNSKGMNAYPVANSYGTALFKGDAVAVSAGNVVRAANGDKILGVFMGCSYINASGTPVMDNTLPASTSTSDTPIDAVRGLSQPVAYVIDDPDATFWIEADSSVSAGDFGLNFQVSVGTGSTFTKQSGTNLLTASASTSGGADTSDPTMVRLVGLAEIPDNDIGDATPLLEVQWNYHSTQTTAV